LALSYPKNKKSVLPLLFEFTDCKVGITYEQEFRRDERVMILTSNWTNMQYQGQKEEEQETKPLALSTMSSTLQQQAKGKKDKIRYLTH
jgi:hypothetical protein